MKSTILQSKALVLVIMLLFCVNIIKAQNGSKWELVGPDNVGGAVRAVLYDKADKTALTMYGGATNGGLLKGLTTKDGTSWSRVPFTVDGELVSLNISSMFQADDNTIYIGTGSIEDTLRGYPVYGKGLYTYKDGKGALVQGTKPSLTNEDWKFISAIQFSNGKLWVATNNGLRYQDENGNWAYAKGDLRVVDGDGKYVLDENGKYVYEQGEIIGNVTDVKVVGNTVLAYINDLFYTGTLNGNDFKVNDEMSKKLANSSASDKYPGAGFMKFAKGVYNDNIVYALRVYPYIYKPKATKLSYLYYAFYVSNDSGATWKTLISGNSIAFFPYFAKIDPSVANVTGDPNANSWNMSSYVDAVFSVLPNSKKPGSDDMIIFGHEKLGVGNRYDTGDPNEYIFSWPGSVSIGGVMPIASPFYLHESAYSIALNPNKSDEFIVGTAGGVSIGKTIIDPVTLNIGEVVFKTVNRGVDVTDFNAVSFTSDGSVLGGTKSNSLQYFDKSEDMGKSSKEFYGNYTNSGSYNANAFQMSSMFENVMFVRNKHEATGKSAIMRTETRGVDFSLKPLLYQNIKDPNSPNSKDSIPDPMLPTTINIWESVEDKGSIDSVEFVSIINYKKGDKIWVESNSQKFPIQYELDRDYSIGEIIKVQDIVTSKAFFTWSQDVNSFNIYVVRGIDNFKMEPIPIRLGRFQKDAEGNNYGMASTTSLSFNGNSFYVMTSKGYLIRMSNLRYLYDRNSLFLKSTDEILRIGRDLESTYNEYGKYGKDVYLTSMSIDPNREERVILTFNKPITFVGATGESKMFICDNTFVLNPVFRAIEVPESMSILSTMFYSNPSNNTSTNEVMVGTTTGLLHIENIESSEINWDERDITIGNVPITDIKQQLMKRDKFSYVSGSPISPKPQTWEPITNTYDVYLSTYGKGVYSMASAKKNDLGINDSNLGKDGKTINVYPNPVTTEFTIKLVDDVDIIGINLIDMSGKITVINDFNSESQGVVKVSNLGSVTNGIYMIQVITNEKIYTSKLIKR